MRRSLLFVAPEAAEAVLARLSLSAVNRAAVPQSPETRRHQPKNVDLQYLLRHPLRRPLQQHLLYALKMGGSTDLFGL
ncbi:hypothetical protein [Ralstonia mannitolilytica]|uniref:hypothetical protein n=1 Tax=Ralstonia mannitolilytica TaxID=105219 RepID=UPI0014255009|nr:hypothetical protein [Ralstonia mannitolilytica]